MKRAHSIIIIFMFLSSLSLISQEKLSLEQAFQLISEDVEQGITLSEEEKSLAVYYFTTGRERTELGDYITNELSSFLSRELRDVSVLSRNKIDEIFEEHRFQLSGLVDPNAVADMGSKLSAGFIGTGYLTPATEHIHLNFQLINVESGEIISGNSIDIVLDDNLKSFIQTAAVPEEKADEIITVAPEYVFTDNFSEFNTDFWKRIQKDEDISVSIEDEHLKVKVEDRRGVNGVNITSRDFRIKTFAMEISFRNPDEEASWISITVGNLNHRSGSSFQIEANIYDGYYLFRYKKKDSQIWVDDDDNLLDELFGDENSTFHTLKLVYDKTNKTAFGYVDDILVSRVEDFAFNNRDRAQVILSVNGRFKNIDVDFDDFKSSIP